MVDKKSEKSVQTPKDGLYYPPEELVENSNVMQWMKKKGMKSESEMRAWCSKNYVQFWDEMARTYADWFEPYKTSVVCEIVKDQPGALLLILQEFAFRRINLTKIESRPSKKKAWEYYFFVDVLGHCEDTRVKKALAELAKHTMFVKILGSYPNVNG